MGGGELVNGRGEIEQRLTVSSCSSPSFLPRSLVIHSSSWLPPEPMRPGTTRGMLIFSDSVDWGKSWWVRGLGGMGEWRWEMGGGKIGVWVGEVD